MRTALVALLLLTAGCNDPGPCDTEAALELVYDESGVPAFAGQALVIEGCGSGRFCHAPGVVGEDRYGAPFGMDFDLAVASTSSELGLAASERLRQSQLTVLRHRALIWQQVERGAMPPSGVGARVVGMSEAHHDRIGEDRRTFHPLPGLDTIEGREIVRNWLACRVPVVERTRPRVDGELNDTGFTAAVCERGCVDATWPSIYRGVVEPRCVSCHEPSSPDAGLDLMASEPTDAASVAQVLERMVGHAAVGDDCVTEAVPLLVPGDTFASLFYGKLTDEPACGGRMPLAGAPIGRQQLCAIEQWIRCGACADATDTGCNTDIEACLRSARLRCEILLDDADRPVTDADGNAQCAAREPCATHATL
jgi:hypothetical protein